MPDTTPIAWRKTFADLDVTLTDLELAAINAGCENMSERDEHLRGHPKDWDHSAFKLLEGGSQHGDDGAAVALDPDAFQIIRYHDHTKDTPWLRFGLQLRSGLEGTERNGNDFTAFVRHGMFQHSDDGSNVDLTDKALDDVAWRLT